MPDMSLTGDGEGDRNYQVAGAARELDLGAGPGQPLRRPRRHSAVVASASRRTSTSAQGTPAARWRAADRERPVEPAGERCGRGVTAVGEGGDAAGRDGRGDGHADRLAELLCGVEQPRGEAGVAFADPGQRRDRDREERQRGACAGDDERPGQSGRSVDQQRFTQATEPDPRCCAELGSQDLRGTASR
jgi:hypothetical protein